MANATRAEVSFSFDYDDNEQSVISRSFAAANQLSGDVTMRSMTSEEINNRFSMEMISDLQLVVRGMTPGKAIDIEHTLREKIDQAIEEVPTLRDHPVRIKYPNDYSQAYTSSLYLELCGEEDTISPKPHLLALWIDPLTDRGLKVDWLDHETGKDRKMRIELMGISPDLKDHAEAIGVAALEATQALEWNSYGYFISGHGNAQGPSVYIQLRDTDDYYRLVKESISLPPISITVRNVDKTTKIVTNDVVQVTLTSRQQKFPLLSVAYVGQTTIRGGSFFPESNDNALCAWILNHLRTLDPRAEIVLFRRDQHNRDAICINTNNYKHSNYLISPAFHAIFREMFFQHPKLLAPESSRQLNITNYKKFHTDNDFRPAINQAATAVGEVITDGTLEIRNSLQALAVEVRASKTASDTRHEKNEQSQEAIRDSMSRISDGLYSVQNQISNLGSRSLLIAEQGRLESEIKHMELEHKFEKDEAKRDDLQLKMLDLLSRAKDIRNEIRGAEEANRIDESRFHSLSTPTRRPIAASPSPIRPSTNEFSTAPPDHQSQSPVPQPISQSFLQSLSGAAQSLFNPTTASTPAPKRKARKTSDPSKKPYSRNTRNTKVSTSKEIGSDAVNSQNVNVPAGQDMEDDSDQELESVNQVLAQPLPPEVHLISDKEWCLARLNGKEESCCVTRPILKYRTQRHLGSTTLIQIPHSFFFFFIIFITFASCISTVQAMISVGSSLNVYAINANGLSSALKINTICSEISSLKPHAFVISETKSTLKQGNKILSRMDNYITTENEGKEHDGGAMWGIVLGIKKKTVQIESITRPTSEALKARVVFADLIIQTEYGEGISHRLVGIYAPTRRYGMELVIEFWKEISDICKAAGGGWSVAGDTNSPMCKKDSNHYSGKYSQGIKDMIRECGGIDAWSLQPDRNIIRDRTCMPWKDPTSGGTIIDRLIFSIKGNLSGTVKTIQNTIPGSDHRAIWCEVIPCALTARIKGNVSIPSSVEDNLLPRIRIPFKNEKDLREKYKSETEQQAISQDLSNMKVDDESSFEDVYHRISKIITQTAEEVYGRRKRKEKNLMKEIHTEEMLLLMKEIKSIGSMIYYCKDPSKSKVSDATKERVSAYIADHPLDDSWEKLLVSLQKERREKSKNLYRMRSEAAWERAKKFDSSRMITALKGGSSRKLNLIQTGSDMPLALFDLERAGSINPDTDKVVTGTEDIKRVTAQYFNTLYQPSPHHAEAKPWMTTSSILEKKKEIERDPFQWPVYLTINSLKELVRKGNGFPSPGPDGWEKWNIKDLGPIASQTVVNLINYMLRTNHVPDCIKPTYLLHLHKRGSKLDLKNYRGIQLTNFIANAPWAWFNLKITPYVTRMRIIPETQVACQKGAQQRDITALLAYLKTWSMRNKNNLYFLKRDQMKGFDFLSPQGFYDAITAFGLPQSIIDLDKSALLDNPCIAKTAYGLAEPFMTSGLTRQGGSLSPLKSVLTTAMLHMWIQDATKNMEGAIHVRTITSREGRKHTNLDNNECKITMLEMMDDSLTCATNVELVQKHCEMLEVGQYAYGCITRWDKSHLYAYENGPDKVPEEVTLTSVSLQASDIALRPKQVTLKVEKNIVEFVNTTIDNPEVRFEEIKNVVASFQFPNFHARIPFTLSRKVISQLLVAKIRQLITLQPITHDQAIIVDRMIAERVHVLNRFPYRFDTKIATLSIAEGGFGFPSIERINQSAALEGMRRDLNHSIPQFRSIARITLADWQCSVNDCRNPMENLSCKTTIRRSKSIPYSWTLARRTCRDFNIEINCTDNSHLIEGKMDIKHFTNLSTGLISTAEKSMITRISNQLGVERLDQIGHWELKDMRFHFDGISTADIYTNIQLERVSKLIEKIRVSEILPGPPECMIEKETRKRWRESWIKSFSQNTEYHKEYHDGETWGTDGSMIPANAKWNQRRVVTSSVVGPKSIATVNRNFNACTATGELTAIAMSLVLMKENGLKEKIIYTDHLNAKRTIENAQTAGIGDNAYRNKSTSPLYRWIMDLLDKVGPCRIEHVKSHTDKNDVPSNINRWADEDATEAHKDLTNPTIFDLPSEYMDEFHIRHKSKGWITEKTASWIEQESTSINLRALSIKPRMAKWYYSNVPNPEFLYTRAVNSYSTMVQIYARSGQLPVRSTMRSRGYGDSSQCYYCPEMETANHLLVECPQYHQWRLEAIEQLIKKVETIYGDEMNEQQKSEVDEIKITIPKVFRNDAIWINSECFYYCGLVPRLANIRNEKLKRAVHQECHYVCVRLAGRIWGNRTKIAQKVANTKMVTSKV